MGNDKAGTSLHKIVHCLLDEKFRSGVDRTGCFVENQNFRIRQNSPCNGQQLLLSLRYVAGFFVENHLITVWQGLDKVVYVSRFGRFNDLLVGCVKMSIADIFHNRPIEQPRIL